MVANETVKGDQNLLIAQKAVTAIGMPEHTTVRLVQVGAAAFAGPRGMTSTRRSLSNWLLERHARRNL